MDPTPYNDIHRVLEMIVHILHGKNNTEYSEAREKRGKKKIVLREAEVEILANFFEIVIFNLRPITVHLGMSERERDRERRHTHTHAHTHTPTPTHTHWPNAC